MAIPKAAAHEPQRNLPHFNPRRGLENRFAVRFARAYRADFGSLQGHARGDSMALAREVPANGYGIADLVSVTWKAGPMRRSTRFVLAEDFLNDEEHTLRAFELKIADWRKALQQASRYRFFAHVPIAVVHAASARRALENLEIFRLIGVGIWTFDPRADIITAHFTPGPKGPRDARHHLRTLRLLGKVTKALPFL